MGNGEMSGLVERKEGSRNPTKLLETGVDGRLLLKRRRDIVCYEVGSSSLL
jgi:hypothetical protein